jgi:hypothetical protein
MVQYKPGGASQQENQKRMKKMEMKNRKDPTEVKAELKQLVVCTMCFWSKS